MIFVEKKILEKNNEADITDRFELSYHVMIACRNRVRAFTKSFGHRLCCPDESMLPREGHLPARVWSALN
ncbi:hypothetical protein CEXT_88171 [Caerostris extrusa]|uniref:Transposase n=1 Tax=Caerostris extrusa TaxID=172846 RepID=A0AAV4WG23_CAEEX|nr:hypothetical protein CEXT_88171 [Caerostris extrusa]